MGQLEDLVEGRDIQLQCPNLGAALDEFTRELGFRLDLIFPADNPRLALLSGHGITVRLESKPSPAPGTANAAADSAVIVHHADEAWGEGRAGMQYRDLVPGRQGGHYIASHIRIPEGGPVADYVHHHHVRFQMIYCYRGWVRVVYEDQGEPFVMRAGDCVLQPPHIRHQVLESSDGMEVIEIGCPAEHETRVDHELALPNGAVDLNRIFHGQRFVFHLAGEASWNSSYLEGFETRDTGIAAATDDLASAVVLRPTGSQEVELLSRDAEFFFIFILAGSMTLQTDRINKIPLKTGDCFVIPAETRIVVTKLSADLELLRVVVHEDRSQEDEHG